MLEDEMYIKDVKIPDIEKIVELKPLEHVNAGNSNTIIPVPLPKPPLFNEGTLKKLLKICGYLLRPLQNLNRI